MDSSTAPLVVPGLTDPLKDQLLAADALRMTAVRRRARARASADAGFSLIESVVALTVAALFFTALGGVLVASLRATLVGRQAQQAADLANRTVEKFRNRDYATIGLEAADAATDPAITASRYAVPSANGTTRTEPIVIATTSPVTQHVTPMALDGTNFSIARYVPSPPADATTGASYKRVTVVVSWTTGGRTRSRSTSTLVGLTRRGLPAPASDLRVTAASQTVSRSGVLTLRVAVTNLGVRSRWTITPKTTLSPSTVDRAWPVTWYRDDGATGSCNGVRDTDETTPAQAGTADTGWVTSGATGCLIGQYSVPALEQPWTPYPLGVTASVATASGVDTTQSATQTRSVQVAVQS